MRFYETLFFMNPTLADDEYKSAIAKFSQTVESQKGVPVKTEEWGKRPLAYAVKRFDRGYYVLLQYCGGPEIVRELQRQMRLDDRILKFQTVMLADNADPEKLRQKTAEEPKPVAAE
jgi:small subunit ribosomal protein S6